MPPKPHPLVSAAGTPVILIAIRVKVVKRVRRVEN